MSQVPPQITPADAPTGNRRGRFEKRVDCLPATVGTVEVELTYEEWSCNGLGLGGRSLLHQSGLRPWRRRRPERLCCKCGAEVG